MTFTENNGPIGLTDPAQTDPGVPLQTPAPQYVPAQVEGLPPNYQGQIFTQQELEERLNRARAEERSKLYPERDTEREELARLRAETEQRRQTEEQAKAEAKRQADEQRQQQELSELDARGIAERTRQEMQAALESQRQEFTAEIARRDAMLEQERRFASLEQHRSRVIATNEDPILPELRDLVTGNSEEEINASIATMVERTARIMANMQEVTGGPADPRMVQGVPPRAPAMGPESFVGSQRSLSADEIRSMSLTEYAKIRDQLPTGRAGTGNGDRGLFG